MVHVLGRSWRKRDPNREGSVNRYHGTMELSSQLPQGSSEPPARSGFGPRGGVRDEDDDGGLLAESASPSQVVVATLTGPPQERPGC